MPTLSAQTNINNLNFTHSLNTLFYSYVPTSNTLIISQLWDCENQVLCLEVKATDFALDTFNGL